jgi:spore coat polysaccharide biosynthesis protein SpsF
MIERSGATDVVRVTANCPLVDPALLDQLIDLHRAQRTDYASIRAQSHHAIAYPHGLDGEVLTRAAFSRMAELGHEPRHREHVTIAIDENPQAFRTGTLTPPPALSRPHASVCVDTADDLQRVRRVVEALGPAALDAGVKEIVAACDRVLGAAT